MTYRFAAALDRRFRWDGSSFLLSNRISSYPSAAVVQTLRSTILCWLRDGGESSRLAKVLVTYFIFRSVRYYYYRKQVTTGGLPRFGFFTLSFLPLADDGHREQDWAQQQCNSYAWDGYSEEVQRGTRANGDDLALAVGRMQVWLGSLVRPSRRHRPMMCRGKKRMSLTQGCTESSGGAARDNLNILQLQDELACCVQCECGADAGR
jgi:hypothetical protein